MNIIIFSENSIEYLKSISASQRPISFSSNQPLMYAKVMERGGKKRPKLQQPQPPEIDRQSETGALGGMIKNSSCVNIKQAAARRSGGEIGGNSPVLFNHWSFFSTGKEKVWAPPLTRKRANVEQINKSPRFALGGRDQSSKLASKPALLCLLLCDISQLAQQLSKQACFQVWSRLGKLRRQARRQTTQCQCDTSQLVLKSATPNLTGDHNLSQLFKECPNNIHKPVADS